MFKELVNRVAVSGIEDDIREFLQEQLKPCCHSIEIDGMGNLHALNHGDGPKFLFIAYMDEPGVIVTKITDDGYLCFDTIGRINPAFLVSKRVSFGNTIGVISLKAIHLTTKEEREMPIKTSQLFIDIGASSKEDAEKRVEIGDYGNLDIPYIELKNGFVKGRALPGRMGCAAAIEILKRNTNCNIHVIFAVQREIKNRGIAGYGTLSNADYAIILDGIKAKDYLSDKMDDTPECGDGVVVISRHPDGIWDKSINDICKHIAKENIIPIQYGISQTQGAESFLIKMGQRNIVSLSIPVRFPDSTAPVANLNDMKAMCRLADGFIRHLTKEEEKCKI